MNLNDYLNDAIGKRDFASKVGDEFRFLEKDVPIDLTGKVLLRVYQEDSLFGFIQRWLISEGRFGERKGEKKKNDSHVCHPRERPFVRSGARCSASGSFLGTINQTAG